MAGLTTAAEPLSRPPLTGRQGTIVTPSGLAVVLATIDAPAGDGDGLPVAVQAVCQAEMWIYRHTRCLVGVFDGRRWTSGWLGADEIRQKAITDAAEGMLLSIATKTPPAPGPDDLAAVRRVFAADTEGETRLGRDVASALDQLTLLRRRASILAKRARSVEARVRYAIGGHRAGLLPDGRRVMLAVSVDKAGRASHRLRVVGKR